MPDTNEERRVALVTGGSSGLGAGVASMLIDRHFRVIIADLAPPAESVASARFERTDVASAGSVRALFEGIGRTEGRLDVLVNAVGIWFRKGFLEIDPEEWDRVCAVNLRGPFLCCQAAAPLMQRSGGGSIVNVGSQAGLAYTRGQGAHYHASKAGLVHLTRVLAFELGPMGVRINCVAPGAMERPRIDPPSGEQAALMQRFRDQTPLDRFVRPDEVVSAIGFLCSLESSGMTGQTLVVNGGALGYL